ncbi:uncharacterized protein [Montipora capricornis]|uniref:uncharacterized protein n=1 Tax=Montipora capricornis TaxID=246305 RepID=UPI0035F19370
MRYVEDVSQSDSADVEMCGLGLYTLTSTDQRRSGYQVQLLLDGKPVRMEVDTGSAKSIISETVYKKLFQHLPLKPTHFYLKTYSGERLTLLGEFQVRVTYQSQEMQLPLVVAESDKPVLLRRNWLDKLKLNWATIFKVSEVNAVDGLIAKYQVLFEKGYGHLKQFKASSRFVRTHSLFF